jgi:Protein of unknown function (DUF2846)
MTKSSALVLSLVWALAGCFAKGTPFTQHDPIFEGEGRLYVYRPVAFTNSGGAIDFVLNGKALSRIRNDGYVSLSLPPGSHTLVAEFPMNMANLQPVGRSFRIRAGRAMYCGYSSSTNGIQIMWRLDCSDDQEAHSELRGCKREPFAKDMGWLP